MKITLRAASLGGALVLAGCAPTPSVSAPVMRDYLYAWTANLDSTRPDFLAVYDVTEDSAYGRLLTTVPVPGHGNMPHHTEHQVPADHRLFASGFATGQTFIFDLTDPVRPRVAGQFGDIGHFTHPHSYLRLPSGNVLATFQMQHGDGHMLPGGIAELTPEGEVIRTGSGYASGIDTMTRAYSAAILPAVDRIVTTTSDMFLDADASARLQVWRMSDLALLRTITLPQGPHGDEQLLTAEPRVLADGRTLLVSTFSCGLYLVEGIETEQPTARLVASFPREDGTGRRAKGSFCAVPAVAGHYYLVTVEADNAVISYDIRDPSAPREAGRVTLRPDELPHWISLSPDRSRVVITGYKGLKNRIVIARFDTTTGALTLDQRFRTSGDSGSGIRVDGVPHGTLFDRR